LAGGRVKASVEIGPNYTFEAWFWNGMPADARPITGHLFSCGPADKTPAARDCLAIGGTEGAAGKLLYYTAQPGGGMTGATAIPMKSWNHVALVRAGNKVRVYLNAAAQPEIAGEVAQAVVPGAKQIFVGGRWDASANFEGKLAEVALYDRALADDEVARHVAAAGVKK
jgi:hypothetical protein